MNSAVQTRSVDEIRASEERLRLFVEKAPVCLAMFDRELRFIAVSQRYIDTFNTPRDLVGRQAYEVFPEIPERWRQLHRRALAGESLSAEEDLFLRADLREQWVKWNIEPWYDSDGKIGGILLAADDITARVDTQRKLRTAESEREQLARQRQVALDSAKMGWWHYNPATRQANWDDTFREIFAIAGNSGPSEDILRLVHPEDRAAADERFRNAMNLEDPQPYVSEYRIVLPDGSIRWVEAHGSAEFAGEGAQRKVMTCSGTVRDITARKLVEEALREQRERYEFVAESADVGFWFCDLPFDKLTWDKRVKKHFWLPPEAEVTIGIFYERLHPEDRERTREAIEESIGSHTQYDIEYRTMSDDGRHKWIRAIGRSFYDDAGRATRFDGITVDVTQRREVEEALRGSETQYRHLAGSLDHQIRERTRELEHSVEESWRLMLDLRDLSQRVLRIRDEERRKLARELHDSAGQLLTALGLELSSMEAPGTLDASMRQHLQSSQALVQQLQSEIRTTSYLLHPPLLDEAGLVSALQWYVQGLNRRSQIDTALEISDDFGRLQRDMELVAFRLIQESLTNVHRHSGSKTATIRVERDAEAVRIVIEDQGKGIPPAKLGEIQLGGSGVGIQGMRERLRQFQGELHIDSSEAGTRVSAVIPIFSEESALRVAG